MPTQPTDPIEWATTGTKTAPPSGLQNGGWRFLDKPPFDIVNYVWNMIFLWLTFFKRTNTRFDDLAAAINDTTLQNGDTFILDEIDVSAAQGTQTRSQDSGFEWIHICATGKSVIVANSGSRAIMDLRDIALMGSASSTSGQINYTFASSPTTIHGIESDGNITVCAYDSVVECWDHTTGVQQWIYTHGAAAGALAIDSVHVYIGGDAGTGTKHVRALNRSTGAVVWSYDSGGSVRGVLTDGRRVFIRQTASSHVSGAHLRSIEALTGKDAANEGGNGTSTWVDVWDTTETTPVPGNPHLFASDGEYLYLGYNTSATAQIRKLTKLDGSIIAGGSLSTGMSAVDVDVDQRYVYVAGNDGGAPDNGELIVFDKVDLSPVWIYVDDSPATHNRAINCVASDGARVFIGGDTSAPDASIQTLERGNRPGGVWKRTDPSSDYQLPYWQLANPSET